MKSYKEPHIFNVSIPMFIRDPDDNSPSGKKETAILMEVVAHNSDEVVQLMDRIFADMLRKHT